jgi:hypothetical protein
MNCATEQATMMPIQNINVRLTAADRCGTASIVAPASTDAPSAANIANRRCLPAFDRDIARSSFIDSSRNSLTPNFHSPIAYFV